MAEETIDVRARLTAEDQASKIVQGYLKKIQDLEKQLKQTFQKTKIDQNFVSPATVKSLEKLGMSLRHATGGQRTFYRDMIRDGKLTEAMVKRQISAVNRLEAAFAASRGKQRKDIAKNLKLRAQEAEAAVAMWNESARKRERIEFRLGQTMLGLDKAVDRERAKALNKRLSGIAMVQKLQSQTERRAQAEERRKDTAARRSLGDRLRWIRNEFQERMRFKRADEAQRERGRRMAYHGFAGMGRNARHLGVAADRVGSVALGGALGVAGAAKVAQSSVGSLIRTDTAEANLRIFGGLSKDQVKSLRKDWLDQSMIKNGLSPADALNAYTEVIKAGMEDPKLARGVTEAILTGSAGLDMDTTNTTKLMGRLFTMSNGRWDADRMKGILNSIAISGYETAADPNEIVAGMRRGFGVLGSSKMTPDQLSAFVATGTSAGMQQGKSGTFMDYLVNELVGSKNERGQKRKDLNKAFGSLGLGGAGNVSRMAAEDPTSLLVSMFEKMKGKSFQERAKIARAIGGREWQGEFLMMGEGLHILKKTLAAQKDPKNQDFLDRARQEKIGTIDGQLKQLRSVATLAWNAVGVGFEDVLRDSVKFFTSMGSNFQFDTVSNHVREALKGLVNGLGFDNMTAMLESTFGKSRNTFDFAKQFGEFFRGLGEGFKTVFNTFKPLLSMFGGGDGAAGLGKVIAEIVGFSIALRLLSPVIGILGGFASVIGLVSNAVKAIAGFAIARGVAGAAMGGLVGSAASAGLGGIAMAAGAALLTPVGIAAAIAAVTLGVAILNWDKISPWISDQFKDFWKTPDFKVPEGMKFWKWFSPSSANASELPEHMRGQFPRKGAADKPESPYKKTAFSSSVEDMNRNMRQMGATVQLASLTGSMGMPSTAVSRAISGGYSGGGSGGVSPLPIPAGVTTRGNGPVDTFGYGPRGSIGGDAMPAPRVAPGTGAAARGSSRGPGGPSNAAERAARPSGPVERFANAKNFSEKGAMVMARLQRDFGLTRTQAAAIVGNLGHESKGLQAINEEKPMIPGSRGGFGWAQWTGKRRRAFEAWCAKNGLDPRSDEANYGFLKHELTGTHAYAIKNLKRHNDLRSATVQFEGDYEGSGVKNYASRQKWAERAASLPEAKAPELAAAGAAGSAPTASQLAASVPPQQGFAGSRLNPQAGGGSAPNVNIHINGHNGDPDALANQVQKRINENMKWRTHDVEFDV